MGVGQVVVVVEWGWHRGWWQGPVARAVELRWIGGGAVGGLAVDWWWQGQGCWR
jgi:hypothetical protein